MTRSRFGILALLLLAGSSGSVEAISTTHERSGMSSGGREGAGIGDDDIPTKTSVRTAGGLALGEAVRVHAPHQGFQQHPGISYFSIQWFLELVKIRRPTRRGMDGEPLFFTFLISLMTADAGV